MAISTDGRISADWKISEVLARYPHLLDTLIELSPAFKHLRNPLTRTVRTRLVSVGQAARVAGMQPDDLVRHLHEAAGLQRFDEPEAAVENELSEGLTSEASVLEELDVRPLLERGEEPFKAIMSATAGVPERGSLRLRVSFEPVPLYAVLARRGFSHTSAQLGPGDWEVVFTRGLPADPPPPRCARSVCQAPDEAETRPTLGEPVLRLDVSDLVPPEPMVRILEAAAQLAPGQRLVVDHHRRPVYLYPQLEAQGFVHATSELGPAHVRIEVWRA